MCDYCNGTKGLLKHQNYSGYKSIDASEVFINRDDNLVFMDLRIATGDIINGAPCRNCYEININYCPKCGERLL